MYIDASKVSDDERVCVFVSRVCFCVACVCVCVRCCCDCAPPRAVCSVSGGGWNGGDDIFLPYTGQCMMMIMLGCAGISSYYPFLQAPGNQSSLRLGISNIRESSEKNSILPKKETSQGFEAEVVKELPECVTNTQHSRLYTEG